MSVAREQEAQVGPESDPCSQSAKRQAQVRDSVFGDVRQSHRSEPRVVLRFKRIPASLKKTVRGPVGRHGSGPLGSSACGDDDEEAAPKQPPPAQCFDVPAQGEKGAELGKPDDPANKQAFVGLNVGPKLPGAARDGNGYAEENIRP